MKIYSAALKGFIGMPPSARIWEGTVLPGFAAQILLSVICQDQRIVGFIELST